MYESRIYSTKMTVNIFSKIGCAFVQDRFILLSNASF